MNIVSLGLVVVGLANFCSQQSIVFGLCACTRARAAGGKRSGCARSKLGRRRQGRGALR